MDVMAAELEAEQRALLAQSARHEQRSARQRQHLSCLDQQVSELQVRLEEQRLLKVGKEKTARRQRRCVRFLENHLEQSTYKLNGLCRVVLDLREDHSHLLQQRSIFCRAHTQLHQQLERQQHVANQLLEKSVLAYNQRSDNLRHMVRIREKESLKKGLSRDTETTREQVRAREAKWSAFMAQKLRNVAPFIEDEESLGTDKPVLDEQVEEDNVELLTKDFQRDPQTHEKFLDDEDKFAVVLFIGHLNPKIEMANKRIQQLQKEILDIELNNRRCEDQCSRQLKDLQLKLEARRSLAASLEQQYIQVREAVDQQKSTIGDLFAKLNCDPALIAKRLGCAAHITDDNVVQFIGTLEEEVLSSFPGTPEEQVLSSAPGTPEEQVYGLAAKPSRQSVQQAAEREDDEPITLPLSTSCALPPPPAASRRHVPAPAEAPQLESELLLDYSVLCEVVRPGMAALEQRSSPRPPSEGSPSDGRRGKRKLRSSSSSFSSSGTPAGQRV
ncbi:unnamed protein product [Merluccius merluccius]